MAEGIAAGMFALRPWDGLHFDPASRAVHPAHGVGESDRDVPDRNELELARGRHVVVSWAVFLAARANGSGVGSGEDLGDDPRLAAPGNQSDGLVNEALEWVDFVE